MCPAEPASPQRILVRVLGGLGAASGRPSWLNRPVLAPGDLIDNRYEVIAPLAEGGMGAVYRARRTLLGDEVAIKVVLQDSPHPEARERFLRESRVAASLRHPSIVSILDFDMPPDADPYLVMELLSGPSLREEIASHGRLELADVRRIVPGICSALQLAHARGVVHRDIKPANIVAHEYEAGAARLQAGGLRDREPPAVDRR